MLNNSTIVLVDFHENTRLIANNESFFIIAITVSLFALSSILIGLCFLHTYLKNLHPIIKSILTILFGYNLICCIVTFIILVYFRVTNEQTITTCSLIQLTTLTPGMLTYDTICIVSVVRYHMTWKINQLESFNKHKILLTVGAVYFAEHILGIFCFIISYMDFSFTQPSTACAGKDTMETVPVLTFCLLAKSVIVCSIGITYDFRLIKLLRKRKLQRVGYPGGIQMIPWKTTSNSDEPTDVKVPIRATIVTLSFILMRIARITYYEIFHNSTIHWIQPVITCQTVIGIVMPVLLLLTIRAHKKKSNPIVPMGPVYHNDHYLKKEEFWESDEENLEYFNDIFAIDPKIFTLDHFSDNHNDGEEISVEIHRAVIHVEPITNIGENNLEEAEGYSEQHNHIFAINPNIFAFDNFSNIDTTNDERQEATIFEINHAVIQVKPAPPYRTFSTCQ